MADAVRIQAAAGSAPARLFALGGLALVSGLLIYLTDRDASRTLLIPTVSLLAGANVFGLVGLWWPSFAHPFAFSLFTAAVAGPRVTPPYGACIAWGVLNLAMEFAQHPALSPRLVEALHSFPHGGRTSGAIANYLSRGTFDIADVAAIVAGAACAALVLRLAYPKEVRDAS